MGNKICSTNKQADVKATSKRFDGKENEIIHKNAKTVVISTVDKDNKNSELSARFVELIGRNCLLCIPKNKEYGAGMVHGVSMDEVLNANKLGYDAYFMPNSGGPKVEEITRFNACYIDIDAGKAEDGKYLPIAAVKERKAVQLAFVHSIRPKPTLIVETRNGYHLYWVLIDQNPVMLNNWKMAEKKLLSLLKDVGADPNAISPNQKLRLPFTYWHKPWANEPPFFVDVVEFNNAYYTMDGIMAALKDVKPYTRFKNNQDGFSCKSATKSEHVASAESNLAKISKYLPCGGNSSMIFLGNVTINIGV